MKRLAFYWLAAASLSAVALRFDAASVRVVNEINLESLSSADRANLLPGRVLRITPGRLHGDYVLLRDVLVRAFQVPANQLIAPSWIHGVHLQITATFAPGAEGDVPAMLRDLLTERFHLAYHTEDRPTAILKLQKADRADLSRTLPAAAAPAPPSILPSQDRKGFRIHYVLTDTSAAVARFLEKEIGSTVVDDLHFPEPRVYVWDFDPTAAGSSAVDLSADPRAEAARYAVQGQDEGLRKIGLHLQPAKAQIKNIVVDKLDKTPTEN